MISQADISRIEEATDIVDLIGEYVSLKKDGAGFKGCCPFHNEKTPSFKVNPARQIYKCFGCGKGGDAVSFVMDHDHLSYPDALRKLAKRAHIEIEERERTAEEIARESKREAMFMLTKQVNDFFVEQIQKNENAMAYAVKRWGKKYVEEMGIGYAPTSTIFMDWVKANCLNIDLLKELHIVGVNDKGGLYAQFRQRITIPQRSRANLINGWTCRDLSGREDTPKYLNSSDSELYQKSELLFGIDVARPEIRVPTARRSVRPPRLKPCKEKKRRKPVRTTARFGSCPLSLAWFCSWRYSSSSKNSSTNEVHRPRQPTIHLLHS